MKILWVTNMIVGELYEHLYNKKSNGLWIDALLYEFMNANEHELIIATTGRVKKTYVYESAKVKYYLLPGGSPLVYNHRKNRNLMEWRAVINKEKPDIIQIWGSEFKQGLAVLKVARDIPSVIYIQGILDAIARYYEAGIDYNELRSTATFRDIIKHDTILMQKKNFFKRAKYEKEMFELSGHVICENLWCESHCKAITPNVRIHYCPLSINHIFNQYTWSIDFIERYSITCNASGYPLKGLHMIIRALYLVKKRYPNVKLYVPGKPMISDIGLISWFKKDGYTKYISGLVKKFGLENNIIFTGSISANQMADRMAKSHVFVIGSALENHSSTLKEAMTVGTPCISSVAGGIPEYLVHDENGMLYRFEEYELLAEYICKVFSSDEFAIRLSENARNSMLNFNFKLDIYRKILNIYNNTIKNR